jgi:hypothetical protein
MTVFKLNAFSVFFCFSFISSLSDIQKVTHYQDSNNICVYDKDYRALYLIIATHLKQNNVGMSLEEIFFFVITGF